MSNKLRRLASVCQHHPHLQQLNDRAEKLTQLDLIVQAILPAQFSGRCRLVNLQQQQLTLMTDSATVASLVRFQSIKICQHFAKHHDITVKKVHVIVRQTFNPLPPRPRTRTTMQLSAASGQLLKTVANEIDNPALQKALTRLSGRVNKRTS